MQLQTLRLGTIKPYEKNPRKNDQAVDAVAESIRQCGYCAPIIVDENMVILAGHTRYKALKKLKIDEVPVVILEGKTEEQKAKYRLLDNKTNEFASWDDELLKEELAGLDFGGFDFHFPTEEEAATEGTIYTSETRLPQYTPVGEEVTEQDLYDRRKTDALILEIEGADIPKEQKDFLIMAANRHTVFNYRKIAEYYAVASHEVQRLMERSALVLIDLDDAIANGFTALTASLDELMEDDIDGA